MAGEGTSHVVAEHGDAEGLALIVRTLYDFMFGVKSDVLTQRDALQIRNEVSAVIKPKSGVLLVRHIGKSPDVGGNFISEYIGIQVAAVGATEEAAVQVYKAAQAEASKRYSSIIMTQCTPSNPTGHPQGSPDQMRSAPLGVNMDYSRNMSERFMRYRAKNSKNEKAVEGNPFQIAYTEEEFLFFSYNDWGNFLAEASRRF